MPDIDIKVLDPIVSRVRTDISAVKDNGKIGWRRQEPITEDNLIEHLNGGTARGVCPIKEGEDTTMVGLLDLDSHKGESTWGQMVEVAKAVCGELKNRNANPIVWRSSGGGGIHVYILWNTPQDAYSVREFLKDAIEALGYTNGTAGVSNKQIEIFPKQNSVRLGGCGNQFILPLAGQSVPLRSTDLELMDRQYAKNMDWPVSLPVPIKEKPTRSAHFRAGAPDMDSLRVLLEYIDPNSGYDLWLKVGMAIYYETKGSEEGLALWDEWSQPGETYPDYEKLSDKWTSFCSDVVRPVTKGTLVYLARQSGYKEDTPLLDQNNHSAIAQEIIDSEFRSGEGDMSLLRTQGQWFFHQNGYYTEREEESIRSVTRKFLDSATKINKKGDVVPFYPSMSQISAITDALRSETLVEKLSPPTWLNDEKNDDAHNYVAMKNGLFHIPTHTLHPHTPEFFTLNALPFSYESEGQPTEWLKFLDSVWADDRESIDTLQELLGYLLTADNSYQKMFLLIGPKRSGKGTIGHIIKELLGAANICGPTLNSLTGEFGLQPLIGKLTAIIPDARIGGKVNKPAIVEKLLMVSGNDNVTVNRKGIAHWNGILSTRILMMTNEVPQLGDSSGALASRFIVLKMHKSFLGQEDHELPKRLLEEMPQIFNWALDGLERLRKRGRFIQPTSANSVVEQLAELNSPLLDFVETHCEIGTEVDYRVSKARLFARYKMWCEEQGRSFPTTLAVFSRDLQSAFPTVKSVRAGTEPHREQVFDGIKIKEQQASSTTIEKDILPLLTQARQERQGSSSLLT